MKKYISKYGNYLLSGIPDTPALANTYYSQFDEDFSASDEDDENAETVIPKKTQASHDDDADILFGSQEGASYLAETLTKKDDENELYNHLQYVLDKDNESGVWIDCLILSY